MKVWPQACAIICKSCADRFCGNCGADSRALGPTHQQNRQVAMPRANKSPAGAGPLFELAEAAAPASCCYLASLNPILTRL